ncbi:DUF3054 domain-containing protein [Cellulomonas fimi]|uniref:DUF3054 domain-containing protein n=1 Tax=Cellulomonas fimi TaxID=1708 RepID=A0A7Y0QHF4_CELFI|nr:DUF3054 domain-containing protein [Cellulomonas fimi]NMR21091.1 DUF3054 domain-containing protein [Cellulomonas fimi]
MAATTSHSPTAPAEPRSGPPRRVRAGLAAAADAVGVLVFAVAGRASHSGDDALADVARIAWPFLAALVVAWVVTRAWRAPAQLWPRGVAIWALTWGLGMVLRGLAGDGRAPAFLAVAAAALGLLIIGWRGVVVGISAARRRTGPPAGSGPGAARR